MWIFKAGSAALVRGQAYLAATYVTTATWATGNIGLSVNLPSAGTYLLFYDIRAAVSSFLVARLYDSTLGAAVDNSERIAGPVSNITASGHVFYTVAGPATIQLQAISPTGGEGVYSDANGRTALGFLKVA